MPVTQHEYTDIAKAELIIALNTKHDPVSCAELVEARLELIQRFPEAQREQFTEKQKKNKLAPRGVRMFKIEEYLFFYIIGDDIIKIVRVLHSGRNIAPRLFMELF